MPTDVVVVVVAFLAGLSSGGMCAAPSWVLVGRVAVGGETRGLGARLGGMAGAAVVVFGKNVTVGRC